MKRFFTKQQRFFIARSAEWKCQICNTDLDNSFHADHIIPFSKGGITNVRNGQALCASCNLSKGNDMSKIITYDKLRPTQQNWVERAEEVFRIKKIMNVSMAPGGGKTIGSLFIANDNKKKKSKIVVVVPSKELVSQWRAVAKKKFRVDLIDGFQYDNKALRESDGFIVTYQALMNKPEDMDLLCDRYSIFAVLDEMHHISDNGDAAWGNGVSVGFENAWRIITLTGTPWRHSGDDILHIERDPETGLAMMDFTVSKRELLGTALRWTEFKSYHTNELQFLDEKTGELSQVFGTREDAEIKMGKDVYSHIIRLESRIDDLFRDANSKLDSIRKTPKLFDAGGLIVCTDTKHAHKIKDYLMIKHPTEEFVIVHSNEKNSAHKIKEFKNSSNKWIIAVDMIAEGVDIPRLQVIIYLSAKRTSMWIWQVLGRAERLPEHLVNFKQARTAYFYYLDDEKLNKIRDEIEEEQGMFIEEEEAKDFEESEEAPKTSRIEISQTHSLFSFLNKDGDIVMDGITFNVNDPIVQYTLKTFSNNPDTAAFDFKTQYAFAAAAFGQTEMQSKEDDSDDDDDISMTPSEKRETLRQKCNSSLKSKITPICANKSNNISKCFSVAEGMLNKMTKVSTISDSSTEDLERRLKLIHSLNWEELLWNQ